VVVDSTLRIPLDANVLDGEAPSVVLTTPRCDPAVRDELRARAVGVEVVPAGRGGVDLAAALEVLRQLGVHSLLVEGGAKIITSLLLGDLVDRLVVSVSPTIIGRGREAVGDLGIERVAEGIRLSRRRIFTTSEDILVAWDVGPGRPGDAGRRALPSVVTARG
jgi:riboflavin biosynthesis pyrimidine reductase